MPIVSPKFKRTASHLFNTGIKILFFLMTGTVFSVLQSCNIIKKKGKQLSTLFPREGGGACFLIKIAREWFTFLQFIAFLLTIFCLVGGSLSVSHTPLHPHPLLCAPMFELYLFAVFNKR